MKKDFDAVAFMRRRCEEIDKEDDGLTWEERTAKTLVILEDDPIWQRFKVRMAKKANRSRDTTLEDNHRDP